MKIGIVCYPTFGGSGVVATELGMALAKAGHEIHFISHSRPVRLGAFQENVFLHEVLPYQYDLFKYSPYESALAGKMVDVVLNSDLDVLHVHYAIPHASSAVFAKQILKARGVNIPIVTTLHGTDITLVGMDKSFAPVVSYSIEESDGVTVVSQYLKDETISNFNIKNHIQVIYNFIDFDRFRKIDKEHFRKAVAPNGEKIIAHTSNFRKVKRVKDVIKSFAQIYPTVKSKLLLIGDGPERPNLEDYCREIGLCAEIRFLGKQDAVEELLAIADLFLLPSANESFGLAALEALACEVPVVSSNIGGLPEVVDHDQNGYLCNVGDTEDMAQKAISILADEEKHAKFRTNALAKAKEFHIDKILPQYEELYRSVIEKSRAIEV